MLSYKRERERDTERHRDTTSLGKVQRGNIKKDDEIQSQEHNRKNMKKIERVRERRREKIERRGEKREKERNDERKGRDNAMTTPPFVFQEKEATDPGTPGRCSVPPRSPL